MTSEFIEIRIADLSNARDCEAILELTDHYAQHPMGTGNPLPVDVKSGLIDGLRAHPTTIVFIARQGDRPVGIANCFVGFSTFKAKPLINIHDLAVCRECQGQGIGQKLIEAVQNLARIREFCAVTLEVKYNNLVARKLYHRMGFQNVAEPIGDDHHLFGKWSVI